MKLVYTHENRLMVGNARGLLEAQGIDVTLRNEYVSGVTGEVPVFDTWPELWVVRDRDYERARNILDAAFSETLEAPWQCRGCGEQNAASFDFCWRCGADYRGVPLGT